MPSISSRPPAGPRAYVFCPEIGASHGATVASVESTDDLAPNPESLYARATDRIERKRLAEAVLAAYRPRVKGLVTGRCPPAFRRDAEQAGAIGLLVALEKYDPTRGVPFWVIASQWVKDEIQKAIATGLLWRPRARNRTREAAMAARGEDPVAARRMDRQHVNVDSARDLEADDVEDQVAEAEATGLLREFAATLSAEDAHLLLCEKRVREEQGNNNRARRYQLLVERAKAFVKGDEP